MKQGAGSKGRGHRNRSRRAQVDYFIDAQSSLGIGGKSVSAAREGSGDLRKNGEGRGISWRCCKGRAASLPAAWAGGQADWQAGSEGARDWRAWREQFCSPFFLFFPFDSLDSWDSWDSVGSFDAFCHHASAFSCPVALHSPG